MKRSKKNLFKIILVVTIIFTKIPLVKAQMLDSFGDGDFTTAPAWTGDISEFIVNVQGQLQLNGSGIGASYLSTNVNYSNSGLEWRFYVKQNLAGSASNNSKVWLTADNANLEDPTISGYYLQMGEAGSADAFEIFQSNAGVSTSLLRGSNAQIAASFTAGVKITCTAAGVWTLFVDMAGGTNYVQQTSTVASTLNTINHFGVSTSYTASNIANFYFDDFYVGNLVVDLTPPVITNITIISNSQVDLQFSESLNASNANSEVNYFVNNAIGNPSLATLDITDASLVHLFFSSTFINNTGYLITVNNLTDLAGNIIIPNTDTSFNYIAPVLAIAFDVVINELMADPDPALQLPSTEFIEVYNRSNKVFNTSGWTISDASTTATMASNILLPGEYGIVCKQSDSALFSAYGKIITAGSLFSLNNTGGEVISLFNEQGTLLDQVYYDETYYNNAQRDDGGFSLERIDANFLCSNNKNWSAANNTIGGTPGNQNSIAGIFTDLERPYLWSIFPLSSTLLNVKFNKPMLQSDLSNIQNYQVSGIGFATGTSIVNTSEVNITIPVALHPDSTYTFSVIDSLKDCPGNSIARNSLPLALPKSIQAGDVLINEILFNPPVGGVDFIELYNNSNKVLNLADLRIANADYLTDQLGDLETATTQGYLFFPKSYLVLSENSKAILTQYNSENVYAFLDVPTLPSYGVSEGVCVITDVLGNRFESFKYNDDLHFALLDETKGVSLERLQFSLGADNTSNWHSAAKNVGYATPGYKNSQFINTDGVIDEWNVQPEVFSPDNDGLDDVVSINYQFSSPGLVGTGIIFDSKGRKIKTLFTNELLGTTGTFFWDGITDQNSKALTGIYLIMIEVFDSKGNVKQVKLPNVVASKF